MAAATNPTFDSTTPITLLLATLAGSAGSWAALTGLMLTGSTLGSSGVADVASTMELAAFAALPVLIVWTIGMALIGSPVWLLADRAGLRSRRAAILIGIAGAGGVSMLPSLIGIAVSVAASTGPSPMDGALIALLTPFGLAAPGGACAGVTIWYRACRQERRA